jgi:asparagine synthase (glutamine-hydrolysing)
VEQLLPGECLECSAAGVRRWRYWDLRFEPDQGPGEAEWARRVRDKLAECVSSHLMSDVPFGAFLSGGVDSSAVVGLMSQAMGRSVSTFSVDFAEQSYSEARFANLVAARFGSDHHLLRAEPEVVSLLPTLIWHADDPLADSSMLPVYLVSEFARRHVTMVLTGDGADELFAGYDTYLAHYLQRLYRLVPGPLRRRVLRPLAHRLPVSLIKVSLDFKAKRFVEGAELDPEAMHFSWRRILDEEEKRALYTPRLREVLAGAPPTVELYRDCFARSATGDHLSRMLYVDSRLYLPSDMLVKVDRMTMANALEARVPFLDHELVELSARVPSSILFQRGRKKHLLKRALRELLPAPVLRRRKAGFNVPVNAWLAGALEPFAREVLSPERLARSDCFQPGAVARLLDEHVARRRDHSYGLWGMICFQLWHELFLAPRVVEAPAEVRRRWAAHLAPPPAPPAPGASPREAPGAGLASGC